MDPTDDLLAALNDATKLLREHGHTHWAQWLARDREQIANGDLHGVTHLLQAFGGMGSLNDVMLADTAENERLRNLCTRIYDRAAAIQRQADRPTTWRLVDVVTEGRPIDVEGIDPWRHEWKRTGRPPIEMPHPSHAHQRHRMDIYEVQHAGRNVTFAAGELSANVWAFYLPEER